MNKFLIILTFFTCFLCFSAKARDSGANKVYFNKLADAIFKEEGANPHYYYGVHRIEKYPLSEPEARRRCLNIINKSWLDYHQKYPKINEINNNFIVALSKKYCPVNWKSWSNNVIRLMKDENKNHS